MAGIDRSLCLRISHLCINGPNLQTENYPKIDIIELHNAGSNWSLMLIMLQHQLAADYTVTVSDRVNNINNSRGALKYKSMSRLV
jgi:hypothetical protein